MDSSQVLELKPDPRGVTLSVQAHAGARRNGILGIRAGALRVAVTAAPEKGKANQAIAVVLSQALGVSKSAIEVVAGATSPKKRILIVGAGANDIRVAIAQAVAGHLD